AHRQPAPREPRQCGRPAPPPWAFGALALRLLERRGGLAAQDARRSRSRGDGPGRSDDSPRPARGLHVSLELQVWLLLWGTLVGLDLVSVPQMMIARPLVAGPIAGAAARRGGDRRRRRPPARAAARGEYRARRGASGRRDGAGPRARAGGARLSSRRSPAARGRPAQRGGGGRGAGGGNGGNAAPR